jgi:hypothetical protein
VPGFASATMWHATPICRHRRSENSDSCNSHCQSPCCCRLLHDGRLDPASLEVSKLLTRFVVWVRKEVMRKPLSQHLNPRLHILVRRHMWSVNLILKINDTKFQGVWFSRVPCSHAQQSSLQRRVCLHFSLRNPRVNQRTGSWSTLILINQYRTPQNNLISSA